ncbi:MAG: polysaccharide pyruvyl transferase family protein [Coleofasciculus sp. S288]|nr:polysaccharide pyruvyl transferase family protein [Coleofasciculus sp. S288]
MLNAIITGITGLRNRGVEALVVPTVEQLCQRQPNLSVKILTKTPDYDELRLQPYSASPLNDYLSNFPKGRLQRLRVKLSKYHKPFASKYQAFVETIGDASVVIASGGDVFSSDYGALHRHLRPLEVALDAGVPVVFLAQSIGPFKRDSEAQAWLQVARRSTLITVRERLSYNYVTKDLGLSPDLVKLTADPAFLLQPPSPQEVANLRKFYGITEDRPVIAIATSQGISHYAGCDLDKHLKAWGEVVQMLLDEFDAQVLVVPHVQEIYASNDDRIMATHLLRSLNFDSRVRLVSADHSASEFKGLIGSCDMVVAERMHAAIAGLSSGVCTVAVGYSIKAEGIMTELLGAESLHDGLLIPVQQFLDPSAACATIRTAWNRRQEVAEQLQNVLPRVKQDSASNFDMISNILH